MKIDLDVYKKLMGLQSATLSRINHTNAIIAEVFKVVTVDKKSLILKICPHPDDYFRETFFLHQLKNRLPVPHIIDTIEPSKSHFGAILMESLQGELLQDNVWSTALSFTIGTLLASLHSIGAEEYGDPTKPKTLTQEPKLYFKAKFQEELDECKGHLPENLIEKCSAYLNNCQGLFASVDGPCIVHRDFRPGNMLISQGQLQGIIDWSSARFGFAEQDFCLIEHSPWTPDLKYKHAFLKGYASVRPLPNYRLIMPLLQLGRALAVIGYTVKSKTWNTTNTHLYTCNCKFLDSFNFADFPSR